MNLSHIIFKNISTVLGLIFIITIVNLKICTAADVIENTSNIYSPTTVTNGFQVQKLEEQLQRQIHEYFRALAENSRDELESLLMVENSLDNEPGGTRYSYMFPRTNTNTVLPGGLQVQGVILGTNSQPMNIATIPPRPPTITISRGQSGSAEILPSIGRQNNIAGMISLPEGGGMNSNWSTNSRKSPGMMRMNEMIPNFNQQYYTIDGAYPSGGGSEVYNNQVSYDGNPSYWLTTDGQGQQNWFNRNYSPLVTGESRPGYVTEFQSVNGLPMDTGSKGRNWRTIISQTDGQRDQIYPDMTTTTMSESGGSGSGSIVRPIKNKIARSLVWAGNTLDSMNNVERSPTSSAAGGVYRYGSSRGSQQPEVMEKSMEIQKEEEKETAPAETTRNVENLQNISGGSGANSNKNGKRRYMIVESDEDLPFVSEQQPKLKLEYQPVTSTSMVTLNGPNGDRRSTINSETNIQSSKQSSNLNPTTLKQVTQSGNSIINKRANSLVGGPLLSI